MGSTWHRLERLDADLGFGVSGLGLRVFIDPPQRLDALTRNRKNQRASRVGVLITFARYGCSLVECCSAYSAIGSRCAPKWLLGSILICDVPEATAAAAAGIGVGRVALLSTSLSSLGESPRFDIARIAISCARAMFAWFLGLGSRGFKGLGVGV